MFHNIDTTAWLSALSRRKLQTATSPSDRSRDGDKLLRRVLLRNSITRVDLALAGAQEISLSVPLPSSSPAIPIPHSAMSASAPALPLATPSSPSAAAPSDVVVVDEFVFPDVASMASGRVYTSEETAAEARWLDSLLENLSDDDEEEDEYDDDARAVAAQVESSPDPEEDEDDYLLDPESLAWLMSTAGDDERPTISVPSPTSVPVRSLSPPRATPHGPLELPYCYPLPDDSDDDLSTPGMEEDLEGESDADSLEWPCTPGSQFRSTASLGRSSSSSSLNQLVACASTTNATTSPVSIEQGHTSPAATSPLSAAVVREGAVSPHPPRPDVKPLSPSERPRIHRIHIPDERLYMSPAEQRLLSVPPSASPPGRC